MSEDEKTVWSWVNRPESQRPVASGPGRYSRPLAVRDQVIAGAFGKEVCRLRTQSKLSTRELARMQICQEAVLAAREDFL